MDHTGTTLSLSLTNKSQGRVSREHSDPPSVQVPMSATFQPMETGETGG